MNRRTLTVQSREIDRNCHDALWALAAGFSVALVWYIAWKVGI